MPITYNGIGTHYYGKKNLQQRPGICRQCNRPGNLQSYDTKLWFVVAFIPIIPLGRKHIIDYCPSCRRHYAADAHKWETAKQLETSGAMDKFRTNPTPENAVAVHQQLLAFHQAVEAADFQQKMEQQFPDNAKIHAYLGDALSHQGQLGRAAACYQRALDLRPDLPEARIGIARARMREGKLDEAQELLSFLKNPGAAQLYSLEPLETLARAYQKAGKHSEALALFKCLMDALPGLEQHHGFRKTVKNSEKALKAQTSILPKGKFSLRAFFQRSSGEGSQAPLLRLGIVVGIFAIVAGIIAVIANEYTRRHRTVYIVNGLGAPIKGTIVGGEPFRVSRNWTELTLAEGHYRAHIDEPVKEDIEFDVRSKYTDRWFNKSVWVINPRGAALIAYERAVYSKHGDRGSFSYYFGKELEHFGDIDYPFTPLPASLTVSSGTQQQVKTHIELASGKPSGAFYALEEERRHGEAVRLAQWRLALADDPEMLQAWLSNAHTNEFPQITSFLQKHLADRPVRMEFHRVYQTLSGRFDADLRDEYDRMLTAEPRNPDLLYLRGRMSEDNTEARDYFKKSLSINPKHAYALYAIAYDECAAAHWETAKPMLETCIKLKPDNKNFVRQWQLACLATHSFEPLEKQLRDEMRADPLDPTAAWHLCETLIEQGRSSESESIISQFDSACRLHIRRPVPELVNAVRYRVLYANGDYAGIEKLAANDRSETGTTAKLWSLVEQGRIDEATQSLPHKQEKDPYFFLTLSLAASVSGKTADAGRLRAQALQILKKGRDKQVAQLLSNQAEITSESVEKLILPANVKMVVIANLATLHPEKRTELAEAARKLNVERAFPCQLVQRATAIP